MNYRVVIVMVGLLFSGYSYAQLDSLQQLKSVEIVRQRPLEERGLTTSEIDSAAMEDEINASAAELLAQHSPIFIKTYGQGGLASASFRGTSASHTQVFWNGMPLNNPMVGQVDFSLIPVYFLDEVELLYGGSSLEQGSGALGGSILLNSRPEFKKQTKLSLVQGLGSFSTYNTFLGLKTGNKKWQTKIRYFHQQTENDFEFVNIADPEFRTQIQENAAYKKDGILAETYYNAGKENVISSHVWWQQADRDIPLIMSHTGAERIENQKDQTLRAVLKWKKYWKNATGEWISSYNNSRLNYYLANETNLGWVVNYDTFNKANNVYNRYEYKWRITSKLRFRALGNMNYHQVKAEDYIRHQGYSAERLESGVSLSLHYEFSEALTAFVFLREELIADKLTPVMPSLGAELRPFAQKNTSFLVNLSRNYHQPTLNDLYWFPSGNPNLLPEQGYTGDLSVQHKKTWTEHWASEVKLTGFASIIDNWIVWRPSGLYPWTAENLKKVFSRGVEVFLNTAYKTKTWKFTGTFNYAFNKTTNQAAEDAQDKSKGKQLIYIPLHNLNFYLTAEAKGYYLLYNFTHNSQRFTTSSNEASRHQLLPYSLNNVSAGKKFSIKKLNGDVRFKVENLLDVQYQAILWRAMPGRNYTIILKLDI